MKRARKGIKAQEDTHLLLRYLCLSRANNEKTLQNMYILCIVTAKINRVIAINSPLVWREVVQKNYWTSLVPYN
jgi:hypothetical protein